MHVVHIIEEIQQNSRTGTVASYITPDADRAVVSRAARAWRASVAESARIAHRTPDSGAEG
jgi:hypothetical protein